MWEFPTLNLYTPSVFYCTEIWIENNARDPKDKYITLAFLLLTWGRSPISSKMPL